MKTTFIYALCEPGTRTVRYIGKANNPKERLCSHLSGGSIKDKTPLGDWLRSLRTFDKTPEMVVLREAPVERRIVAEERYIRLALGLGMDLLNKNRGGGGPICHTLETRFKIGKASREFQLGRKLPAEHCKNIGRAKAGKKLPPRTPEQCAAISARQKGVKKSAETCAAMSAGQKALGPRPSGKESPRFGVLHSPETKTQMRASQQARRAKEKLVEAAPKQCPKRKGTSKFLGVSWLPGRGKWRARARAPKKEIHIGVFSDEREAAKAYDFAILKLIGPSAKVNFSIT